MPEDKESRTTRRALQELFSDGSRYQVISPLLERMMSRSVTTGIVVHRNEWRELCLKAREGEAVPPNPYETGVPTSYMGLPVTVTDLPWMEGLFVELKNGETWEDWQRKRVEAHQHSQDVRLKPGDV